VRRATPSPRAFAPWSTAGSLSAGSIPSIPARFEYRLTEAGRELYPVLLTLMRWGDRHLAGPEGPPARFEHNCGHPLVAQVVCEACGEPVQARDTRLLTGR
jgi:hypothetical protein